MWGDGIVMEGDNDKRLSKKKAGTWKNQGGEVE